MKYFTNTFYLIWIILAVLYGILILGAVIGNDFIVVVPIALFGLFDLGFEWLADREFAQGFHFFDKLAIQAHKIPRKFWNLSKKLVYLLLLNMFSFSLVASFLEAKNIDDRLVLFKGAIFICGIAALSVGASVSYKQTIGPKLSVITNNKYRYKFKIPSNWGTIYSEEYSDTIRSIMYGDPFIDVGCIVIIEDKTDYEDEAGIVDFCKLQDDVLDFSKDVTVNSKEIIKSSDGSMSIISNITINNKKYGMYRYLRETVEHFYEMRFFAVESKFQQEECLAVVGSFEVKLISDNE